MRMHDAIGQDELDMRGALAALVKQVQRAQGDLVQEREPGGRGVRVRGRPEAVVNLGDALQAPGPTPSARPR